MHDGPALRLLTVMRDLAHAPTLDFAAPPEWLAGGFWAELLSFRLDNAPAWLSGDLVARVMPDPATARKETAIQAEVAGQGFPTPAVHLAGGPETGLGRAFMVMDLAQGALLLAGLDGMKAIRRLPHLFASIPKALATPMAELHRLDPAPVRARLEDAGSAAPTISGLLDSLLTAADLYGRRDLVGAAEWLAANPPSPSTPVICHGDLHPFNVLVDGTGNLTVLDWSAGVLAPREYDAAFTSLLLAEPPLAVPRAGRRVVRAGGRLLARRFLREYRERGGAVDAGSLRWHQSVVCLRALVEVAGWASAGEVETKSGHPWLVCGPAFASRLSKLTGVMVRPC